MFRRIYNRIRNLSLKKKIALANIVFLLLVLAVMGFFFFDYYSVTGLKDIITGWRSA